MHFVKSNCLVLPILLTYLVVVTSCAQNGITSGSSRTQAATRNRSSDTKYNHESSPVVNPGPVPTEVLDLETPFPDRHFIEMDYRQVNGVYELNMVAPEGGFWDILVFHRLEGGEWRRINLLGGYLRKVQGGRRIFVTWDPFIENGDSETGILAAYAIDMKGFIYVEGGSFNNGRSDVWISSFYIHQYELSQAEYQTVMGTNPSHFRGKLNRPVERVSWYDAIEYCNRRSIREGLTPCYRYGNYGTDPDSWPSGWDEDDNNHTLVTCSWTANGYRLPTEAEWEFAARGGKLTHNYSYSGSNTIGDVAWYSENSRSRSHEVGTKQANELGIYDMSGNVWEWCWDILDYYLSGTQTNPKGVDSGSYRVLRGGDWDYDAVTCTVSTRGSNCTTVNGSNVGFRVVRNSF